MPRTSRAVAQRLASQKGRKRRVQRVGAATSPAVEQLLDEVAPESTSDLTIPESAPTARRSSAGARTMPPRRRYAEYGAEYGYVWSDLRRIALVAGSLVMLLFILSLFIR